MLIGISGFAGSGKDTLADFFVHNYNFCKVPFADIIKRICKDIYDFSDTQLWGPSEERNKPDKRYPRTHTLDTLGVCKCCGKKNDGSLGKVGDCFLTPRYVLQLFGTECGRHCYENTWVNYTLRIAHKLLSEPGLMYTQHGGTMPYTVHAQEDIHGVVISDVRFKNEIDVIHNNGGQIIRVKRSKAGLKSAAGKHESEAEMKDIPDDAFDMVINNDGTLEDLEKKAHEIFIACEIQTKEYKHSSQIPNTGFIKFGH